MRGLRYICKTPLPLSYNVILMEMALRSRPQGRGSYKWEEITRAILKFFPLKFLPSSHRTASAASK
jgi:hypothetical protein